MSGITRRTVYYENTDGEGIKFLDWAIATTGIGSMMEPFQIDDRCHFNMQFDSYGRRDMINRVDVMRGCNMRGTNHIMNFGNNYKIHEGMGLRDGP